MAPKNEGNTGEVTVIFRRFRRDKSGKLLDAWQHGIRAWPIKVRNTKKKS